MTAFRKAFRDRDLGFLDEGEQTLGMLIDTWKASPEWERLASSTGRVWGLCGRGRPQALGRRAPVGLRGYAHPQADYRLAQRHEGNPVYRRPQGPDALHRAQARQAGLVQINLAEKIGKLYVKERRAVIIWTNADMAALRAAAVGTRQEGLIDVVELAAAIDLRRADLVRVTWNDR